MAGYEIAYTGDLGQDLTGKMVVYLAAGSNPITSEEWETYTPPTNYSLNTPRAIVFSELNVLGSPYVPTGELTYITTSDGFTWESVAALQRSVYPYIPITVDDQTLSPQQIAYSISTPPAGVILVDSNDKNHENIYYGINDENASKSHIQYFVSDPWGNTYILKSVNAANSTPDLVAKAVSDAVLPPGWTKLTPSFFQEDTIFSPSYSGLNDSIAHANEFRDSADSAWMQTTWSPTGQTLSAVAAGGLPIWAGSLGGSLLGSINNDVIYGAQGNDFITSKDGDDYVDGGAGLDHSIFSGNISQYAVSVISTFKVSIEDTVANRDGIDTLERIERFVFNDSILAVDTGAGESAGVIARLYQGALSREGDSSGLGYWITQLDNGNNSADVASGFINSDEFLTNYGSDISDGQFITNLYSNMLGRAPDAAGYAYWFNEMQNGATKEQTLINFSESAEGIAHTYDLLVNGVNYSQWLGY
jgi:hypothetical protein